MNFDYKLIEDFLSKAGARISGGFKNRL